MPAFVDRPSHRPWRDVACQIAREKDQNKVLALISELRDALDARPSCAICHEPCDLETCKTDEAGHAIHEHCLVLKMNRAQVPSKSGPS